MSEDPKVPGISKSTARRWKINGGPSRSDYRTAKHRQEFSRLLAANQDVSKQVGDVGCKVDNLDQKTDKYNSKMEKLLKRGFKDLGVDIEEETDKMEIDKKEEQPDETGKEEESNPSASSSLEVQPEEIDKMEIDNKGEEQPKETSKMEIDNKTEEQPEEIDKMEVQPEGIMNKEDKKNMMLDRQKDVRHAVQENH